MGPECPRGQCVIFLLQFTISVELSKPVRSPIFRWQVLTSLLPLSPTANLVLLRQVLLDMQT